MHIFFKEFLLSSPLTRFVVDLLTVMLCHRICFPSQVTTPSTKKQDSIDSETFSNVQNSIQQNTSRTSKQQVPLPLNSIGIGNLLDGLKDIDDENRFRLLTNHFHLNFLQTWQL